MIGSQPASTNRAADPTGTVIRGAKGNVQDYDYDIKFTNVGPVILYNGKITKRSSGKTGWVLGAALVVVNPTDGSSCNNLNRLSFILAGTGEFLILTA